MRSQSLHPPPLTLTCEFQVIMDVKAKAQSTIVLGAHSSRKSRDSIKNIPSLYLPHYPRQHITGHTYEEYRGCKIAGHESTTPRGRKPMRESADPQVAMVGTSPRTQVRKPSSLIPTPHPTGSKPKKKSASAGLYEEDDSDDVFGIGIGGSSNLEAKASEIRIQGFLNGKHREHATAIKEPHRRIRPCDNLNDIFEGMRALQKLSSIRPEASERNGPLAMTKSVSAVGHYAAILISSTRSREALVSLGERSSARVRE